MAIAGTSVITCPSSESTGTRFLGLMWAKASVRCAPSNTFVVTAWNGTPISWSSTGGAGEQAPGENQNLTSATIDFP